MELKEGTSVFTPNGDEVGRINRFVLDPATNEVTHIVVQKAGSCRRIKLCLSGWLGPPRRSVSY